MPNWDKRDRVAAELKRRLEAALKYKTGKCVRIVEGDGGMWGSWNTTSLPVVHWFEDSTAYTYQEARERPGVYEVSMPVQLEYIVAVCDKQKIYQEAREALGRLRRAIELDERFAENGGIKGDFGQTVAGEELCIWYGVDATEAVEVANNTLDIAVVYTFIFTEKHLGYTKERH